MTEQLHDLLARIADEAGPGSNDATLWARARRARRRERALRVASVTVLAAAVVFGAVAIGLSTHTTPPPANRHTPAPHEGHGAIPSTVQGIHGDGGLDLESDLAVGPASVAIANRSGAFVVTAADGAYHRLRLPGFDPERFDPEHPGLALSPDGTRLAYGWHQTQAVGSKPRSPVGTRIVDLRSGAVLKIPGTPAYVVDPADFVSTYGYDWSPNGRYVGFETVTGQSSEHWYVGVDTSTASFIFFLHEPRLAACEVCKPMTLVDRHRIARVDPAPLYSDFEGSALVFGAVSQNQRTVQSEFTPLPAGADWTVGRFTPDGRRILLQPDGVGPGLVLVTNRNPRPYSAPDRYEATSLSLDPAEWPDGAEIDVLGWVGSEHALTMVNRGTGSDTSEPGGELVLVDIDSVADTTADDTPVTVDVVGHIDPGDPATTYSFATDFATVGTPTQDFDAGSSALPNADPIETDPISSQGDNDGETTRLIAYAIAGMTAFAVLTLVLTRQRRKKRNIHIHP
jgi:hypothetical protein